VNWDAIGALAEAVGTVAVLITLVYLAIQLKIANKQREIESLRHNWDGLNQICGLLSESPEKASIILRGRNALRDLTDEERLIFQGIHIHMLNTIEAWYLQLMETSPPGAYRDRQVENMGQIVHFLFDFPGARELWSIMRNHFTPIAHIFDDVLSSESEEIKA
jgi:hypothetical protein